VLAESFRRHNPQHRFFALAIDDLEGELDGGETFQALTPQQVGIDRDELHRRATMFTGQGLAVSAKPNVIRYLLRVGEPVLLLDADSCVYGDLGPVGELAARHSLVISPHSLDPHPLHEEDGVEQVCMRWGVMNTGLLATAGGAEPFLDWWAERTARRCVIDLQRGLVMDQGWVNVAMMIFEHHILRDRGCNVMGWNLQARDVEWRGEKPFIDGAPLRHFHFINSFDPKRSHVLAPFQEDSDMWLWPPEIWPSLDERPGVARICREYAGRLRAAGHVEWRASRGQFEDLPDGQPLERWMRERYRLAAIRAEIEGGEEPPNPFTHGADRFVDWVRRNGPPPDASPELRAGAAEAEVQTLRRLVGELTNSRSWKATRPLRSLGAALRRIGH
jgi:hypothetical protein